MMLNLKVNKNDYTGFSFSISVIVHVVVFVAAAILMNLNDNVSETGVYVQLSTINSQTSLEEVIPGETNSDETKETIEKTNEAANNEITTEEKKPVKEKTIDKNNISEKNNENIKGNENSGASFYSFSDGPVDTANLVQYYKESTLNVSVKYPAGWKYIDQNVKNKLDGVTFWTPSTTINPPPYVHIEVQDKDLFNPKRFQHTYKTRNYAVYYNDPEELSGQFNQIIYIRTNTDEDFSLKLIMKGEEAFKMFQPVFFGMVKSFKYGTGYF